jgi:hypothetical protein
MAMFAAVAVFDMSDKSILTTRAEVEDGMVLLDDRWESIEELEEFDEAFVCLVEPDGDYREAAEDATERCWLQFARYGLL